MKLPNCVIIIFILIILSACSEESSPTGNSHVSDFNYPVPEISAWNFTINDLYPDNDTMKYSWANNQTFRFGSLNFYIDNMTDSADYFVFQDSSAKICRTGRFKVNPESGILEDFQIVMKEEAGVYPYRGDYQITGYHYITIEGKNIQPRDENSLVYDFDYEELQNQCSVVFVIEELYGRTYSTDKFKNKSNLKVKIILL